MHTKKQQVMVNLSTLKSHVLMNVSCTLASANNAFSVIMHLVLLLQICH